MNGFLTSAIFTPHLGQSGGRGRSPRIWSRLHGQESSPDGGLAAYVHSDEFLNFGTIAPGISGTAAGEHLGYKYYVDTTTTACTIKQLAGEGGIIQFATGATANHEAVLATGADVGTIGTLSLTGSKPLGFEARVRFGQVTGFGAALGLFAPGICANDALGTTGAMSDTDFIGFLLDDSGANLRFAHRANGEDLQTNADVDIALTADTWVKVGFVIRPDQDTEFLSIVVDNEIIAYISRSSISADTFPSDVSLLAAAAIKAYGAAAVDMDLDWLDVGQSS